MSEVSVPSAVGGWRLRLETKRGVERPVLALAADGTGIFQSPEGPLPVTATYDGDEVMCVVEHQTVMTQFKFRVRGTIDGDSFVGAWLTAGGPHPVTGERIR